MTPIEQKLYEFYNSSDYRTLERAISESNLSFSQLPEKLKLTSLFLHQNGQDGVITDMWRLFHKFEPPVLSDYMTNPKVGGSIVDNIYTGWKKHIIPDYSNGKHPQEIVFTGAIGTGKSTLSIFLQLWNLVRVCSLINPQATLNVTSNTLLVLALFTVTLEKASLALIKPFIAALEDSPYFAQVDKEAEFNDYRGKPIIPYLSRRGVVEFPNNIIINIGSTVNHAISYSMFGAMLDEAEFGSAGPAHAFSLYTNLRERVRSRFLGSKFTLLTLISSARYSQGIIADFVNSISPDDTFTKIYSFPIWEIKHFDAYKDGGKFYVLVGNSNNPHRILSVVEQQSHEAGKFVIPQNCKVIQVPEVYRKDFEGSRISEALQNLAGEAVLFTSTYIFQDLDKIEHEGLVPEIEIVVELGNGTKVIDLMPDKLFEVTMNGKRFKIAPSAERFIHFDLATVNEAGIACVHIETDKDKFVYVVDFVIKVKAEAKIDLAALRNFAEDLSKVCYLKKLTTDQFESALFRQELTVKEVADRVEVLSTIKTTEPYTTLSRLAYNSQLCVGKAPELKKQLTNTQIVNGKILLESHGRSHGDMADAICGAVYSCVMDIDSHQRIQYDVSSWKNSELVTIDSVAFKLKDWLEI